MGPPCRQEYLPHVAADVRPTDDISRITVESKHQPASATKDDIIAALVKRVDAGGMERRAAEIAARKQTDIIYLGREVSRGLPDRPMLRPGGPALCQS